MSKVIRNSIKFPPRASDLINHAMYAFVLVEQASNLTREQLVTLIMVIPLLCQQVQLVWQFGILIHKVHSWVRNHSL